KPADITSATGAESISYQVTFQGKVFSPAGVRGWSTHSKGMRNLIAAGRVLALGNTLSFARFVDDYPVSPLSNNWTDTIASGFGEKKSYVVQTGTKVIER